MQLQTDQPDTSKALKSMRGGLPHWSSKFKADKECTSIYIQKLSLNIQKCTLNFLRYKN